MPKCNSCEGHVSEAFARVYAGNDGELQACPNCATQSELQDGAAANGGAA